MEHIQLKIEFMKELRLMACEHVASQNYKERLLTVHHGVLNSIVNDLNALSEEDEEDGNTE